MTVCNEYPDFFARFYDVIYRELRTADKEFFLKKIKESKGKVLEIGVGTGRFFIDALNQGADIYGIDISKNMIDVLRKKIDPSQYFRISNEDACTMKLKDKFDLIIAPFRVFAHILETGDQLKFLNNVFDHLNEAGVFIFDLFVPNPEILHKGLNQVVDFEGEYQPGKKLKRTTTTIPDIVNQFLDITMKFEWEENNLVKIEKWNFKLRLFFRYELEYLIRLSSLKLDTIYGDYFKNPVSKESKEFVVICLK